MIFIFYLTICIFLSIMFSILTKKNNLKTEKMKKDIEFMQKVNNAVVRWEKRRYRRRV